MANEESKYNPFEMCDSLSAQIICHLTSKMDLNADRINATDYLNRGQRGKAANRMKHNVSKTWKHYLAHEHLGLG